MLILDHKSFQAATPAYVQHYLHLERTLMGLVAVIASKYYILWEKLLQIPCAQIMEYVC